jgi:UDP-N-acetylmuramoyl-tripeptide--D-alanyl-D-alanine ligase
VAKAKLEIFNHAAPDHATFYNIDDETLRRQRFPSKQIKTFGIRSGGDVRAKDLVCQNNGDYAFNVESQRFELCIPGQHNVYNALAAIAVGQHFEVPLEQIAAAIQTVRLVEHRMNVMNYHDKIIIDDAYNANPGSCAAALQTMADIRKNENRRRIAVLGDMLELGAFSESEHKKLATVALDNQVDALFLFGAQMNATAQIAEEMSFQFVKHYQDQHKLADELLNFVAANDVILVKGSRSMHMEHVVNALLNEPA